MKGLGISQSSLSVGACGRSKLEKGAGKADPGHRGGSDGHISFTLPVKESPAIDMFPFFFLSPLTFRSFCFSLKSTVECI